MKVTRRTLLKFVPTTLLLGVSSSAIAKNAVAPTAEAIKISRSGGLRDQWRGLCPFHKEKTPSLVVHPDNTFYCYGCKTSGFADFDHKSNPIYAILSDVKFLVSNTTNLRVEVKAY